MAVIYGYIIKASHYNKQLANSKIIIYKPLKPINERMQSVHLKALKKQNYTLDCFLKIITHLSIITKLVLPRTLFPNPFPKHFLKDSLVFENIQQNRLEKNQITHKKLEKIPGF